MKDNFYCKKKGITYDYKAQAIIECDPKCKMRCYLNRNERLVQKEEE